MLACCVMMLAVGSALGADIVQTLVADQGESTLVQLVTKAGLGPALSGDGPLTVFAPSDAAFAAVPAATLASLQQDTAALADLLKYHVLAGRVLKHDLKNEQTVATLAGKNVRVNIYSHNHVVTVQGVPVTHTDQLADNGVIHRLSGVLTPPSGDIVDLVAGDDNFSTLLHAVQQAGIVDALKADHRTVFAPTNAAFEKMRSSDLQKILNNKSVLKEVLSYHVIDHTLYSAGLYDREYPSTVDRHHDHIIVHVRSSSGVTLNNHATVTQADVSVTNGVVHVIDHVLIPPRVAFWLRTGLLG